MVRRFRPVIATGVAGLTSPLAGAAGFALIEQSGSNAGLAYAGTAASADDASALFFNPAALSLLERPQLALAAHGIDIQTEFDERASSLPPAGLGALPAGATRNDAGDLLAAPNVYGAWPLSDPIVLGVGLSAPFGLKTEYDDPWIGRFQGIRSELVTLNVNAALSWRVTDTLTVGAGINYQWADAELTNAVLLGPGVEGRAELDVDDDAWGWNIGALLTWPAQTRLGVSYRSSIDYTLEGDTTVTTLDGTTIPAASGATRVEATFPDSAILSVAQPVGTGMEIRADVQWTHWSEVDRLVAINSGTGLPRDVLTFAFDDAWRAALGVTYDWTDRWTFRGGVAWDETPVRDEFRTVRLPDEDRWWIALGARWQPNEQLAVDAGYAHLFIDDPAINLTRPQLGAPASFASTVNGTYDSAVDILSVQLTWNFAMAR